MKQICIGDRYQIQCYKHNGKIHRAWDEAIVLDVKKEPDRGVCQVSRWEGLAAAQGAVFDAGKLIVDLVPGGFVHCAGLR